ncbi:MAG: ATP phosphoribosyltransferase regulatory subunit [Zetaproteobacteria bacterium]|nr:ATP phosphoribosyltransferase regulatory subunit [Zetaproteobacteria bacterium]
MTLLKPILGLEDTFGERALALRQLQFELFKIYNQAGFSEVIPPLLERPQSLSSGAGAFLADQTLMFSDPSDAGQLAIRPDMTPQIARIAATRMRHSDELKLYYSGQVMLARPDERTGSRQQWQTGVEYLGGQSDVGDVEVIHLAALSMQAAGFELPVLQLGHMGLIQALVADSGLSMETWVTTLARRSPEDMKQLLVQSSLNEAHASALMILASGCADDVWLKQVKDSINDAFGAAADELLHLSSTLTSRLAGDISIQIEAAVMPRFLYHTGMVFTGFAKGATRALLHGGRYDKMMAAHGRDMPATGFSFDLLAWLSESRESANKLGNI